MQPRKPFIASKYHVAAPVQKPAPSTSYPSFGIPPEYDYLFKLIIVGDSGVGKSCLLLRFADETYTESYISTIGVDFKVKTIDLNNKTTKLQIWDTVGQDRLNNINHQTRGWHGFMVVFDLTDQVSFNNAKTWVRTVNEDYPKANIILVGTKADLPNKRVIDPGVISDFIDNEPAIDGYVETSAKTGENVYRVFEFITQSIMKRLSPQESPKESPQKVSTPDPRSVLKNQLSDYISRIEKNNAGGTNFSHGFWFFSESRSINREANYYLAQKLLNKLVTSSESITSIFNAAESQRQTIIKERELFTRVGYVNRGIKSSELNSVIEKALALESSKQKPRKG